MMHAAGFSAREWLASCLSMILSENRFPPRITYGACFSGSCSECPASEVRDTSQQPLRRTSEAKGHSLVFDSSAAYRLEVPERACCGRRRDFQSAALAA